MVWIPIAAWIAAVTVALVVLGFCGYELFWKSRRLQADLRELGALATQLAALRDEALAAQSRLAAAGLI